MYVERDGESTVVTMNSAELAMLVEEALRLRYLTLVGTTRDSITLGRDGKWHACFRDERGKEQP